MNAAAFFDSLRGSILRSGVRQSQVDALMAIIAEAEVRGTPLGHLAYIMATAYHEPGAAMVPVSENLYYTSASRIRAVWPTRFRSTAAAAPFVRNPRALANEVYNGRMGNREGSDDGWNFRGRGLVQLTGRDNYAKGSKATRVDLIAAPDRASEIGLAVTLLFSGMTEGWFTGLSLSDVDGTPSYEDDRRVVNGTDRAALIAGYARAFESALRAGGYTGEAAPSADGFTPEEIAALRALAAWWAKRPADANLVLRWLATVPKELTA